MEDIVERQADRRNDVLEDIAGDQKIEIGKRREGRRKIEFRFFVIKSIDVAKFCTEQGGISIPVARANSFDLEILRKVGEDKAFVV